MKSYIQSRHAQEKQQERENKKYLSVVFSPDFPKKTVSQYHMPTINDTWVPFAPIAQCHKSLKSTQKTKQTLLYFLQSLNEVGTNKSLNWFSLHWASFIFSSVTPAECKKDHLKRCRFSEKWSINLNGSLSLWSYCAD